MSEKRRIISQAELIAQVQWQLHYWDPNSLHPTAVRLRERLRTLQEEEGEAVQYKLAS